jgi:hypothetical protein
MRVDRAGLRPAPLPGRAWRRIAGLARQTAQEKVYSPDHDQETEHDADPMKDMCH